MGLCGYFKQRKPKESQRPMYEMDFFANTVPWPKVLPIAIRPEDTSGQVKESLVPVNLEGRFLAKLAGLGVSLSLGAK